MGVVVSGFPSCLRFLFLERGRFFVIHFGRVGRPWDETALSGWLNGDGYGSRPPSIPSISYTIQVGIALYLISSCWGLQTGKGIRAHLCLRGVAPALAASPDLLPGIGRDG